MRINESRLKEIILEEVDNFLEEQNRKHLSSILLGLIHYIRLFKTIDTEQADQGTYQELIHLTKQFENMKNALERMGAAEFLVDELNIDQQLVGLAMKPLYTAKNSSLETIQNTLADIERSKQALEEIMDKIELKLYGDEERNKDQQNFFNKDTQDDISTVFNKKSNQKTVSNTAATVREENLDENAAESFSKHIESMIKSFESRKSSVVNSGNEETQGMMEKEFDRLIAQMQSFQAALGKHVVSPESSEELAETDLPQLTGRDPTDRKAKHDAKARKKQRGRERREKKGLTKKEQLMELFGWGKEKGPEDRVKALWKQFKRFRRWSNRAREEGRREDFHKWDRMADQIRNKAEQMEKELGITDYRLRVKP